MLITQHDVNAIILKIIKNMVTLPGSCAHQALQSFRVVTLCSCSMQLRTAPSTGGDGHIPMPLLKALDGNRASSYQISPPLLDSLEHVAGGIPLGGILITNY